MTEEVSTEVKDTISQMSRAELERALIRGIVLRLDAIEQKLRDLETNVGLILHQITPRQSNDESAKGYLLSNAK